MMAYMIPETIPRRATAGERVLFQTLRDYLPGDYIAYYEPEIKGKKPDFVVIGPDLGLVVLEVKDYTRHTLFSLNRNEWQLHTSSGQITTVSNPYNQARDYAYEIVKVLTRDKNLIQLEGNHIGKLKFQYGYGAVFTRLKQKDFIQNNIHQIIPPEFVFCRDEIDPDEEGFSEEVLMEKLLNMFIVRNPRRKVLSNEDIQAIRYHLFPEVRISAEPVYYQDQLLLSLHDIKTMDLYQENLAKQLGDKHRLIRGVAGSGKTLVLASRTKILARTYPEWRILVLCFGIPLSRSLRQLIDRMMEEADDLIDIIQSSPESGCSPGKQIEVYNFHEWLRNKLNTREELIPQLLGKIEKNETILPTYDAILIDEGQDFESEWLKLLGHMLNPKTQSLLLVEDRAQSIFKRKNSLAQDTGLDFRGRSKILTINYRNTAQIVQFAWDFYRTHSLLQNKVKQGTTEGIDIIPPQSTRRQGPEPRIARFDCFVNEIKDVVEHIRKLHREHRIPYGEMLILYRVKNTYKQSYIDIIKSLLKQAHIPYTWITENSESKRNFNRAEQTVKISTIDSAKGLDFRAVFIVNIENMPFVLEEEEEREVSLFYIGMTRSLEWLFLSYSGDSKFTKYLDDIVLKRKSSSIHTQSAIKL